MLHVLILVLFAVCSLADVRSSHQTQKQKVKAALRSSKKAAHVAQSDHAADKPRREPEEEVDFEQTDFEDSAYAGEEGAEEVTQARPTESYTYTDPEADSWIDEEQEEAIVAGVRDDDDGDAAILIRGQVAQGVIEELQDLKQNFEQAEHELEHLRVFMRKLQRQEQSVIAASLLQVEEESSNSEKQAPIARGLFPCQTVVAKALLTVDSFLNASLAINASWVPPVFVQDIFQENNTYSDALFYHKVSTAISWVSLYSAAQSGHGLWTSHDQSVMQYYCIQGLSSTTSNANHNLEEQGIKVDIVQGDIRVTQLASSALWPDGNVPYCFAPGLSTIAKTAFILAVKHIQSQVSCLNFAHVNLNLNKQVPTCSQLPSIIVTNETAGCSSYLGYIDMTMFSQKVNLGTGCEIMGMAAHQLMHALGVPHEIGRRDRNEYVAFDVDSATRLTTQVLSVDIISGFNSPNAALNDNDNFDLLSVTMHSSDAFTPDGYDTIEPNVLPILARYMGQRHGLSQFDVEHLATLYGCNSTGTTPLAPTKVLTTSWLLGDGIGLDGSCADRLFTGVGWTDGTGRNRSFECSQMAQWCKDPTLGVRTRNVCPQTCLQCIQPPLSMQIFLKGMYASNIPGITGYNWRQPDTYYPW